MSATERCIQLPALLVLATLLGFAGDAHAGNPVTPLDLRQVTVGGEMGRRIAITIQNNLNRLDLDGEFLRPFQNKQQSGGFVGLGMLIDSAVGLAAYSGDPEAVRRARHLVDAAIEAQEADGYLGTMRPEARMWKLWDIHEMSYLIQGLLRDDRLFDQPRSLAAARKIADYIVRRWTAKPNRRPGGGQITVRMAVTGLEPAMLRMYQATNDAKYLEFCTGFRHLAAWDGRIVLGRFGPIAGHAYAHCSRCIAQLWLHDMRPADRLFQASRDVMQLLTAGDGLVVTGASGYRECWHDTQDGTAYLGETCATAYLLRLWHELFLRQGHPLYGDLMERAIFNALFSAQSPDGRRIRYYVPLTGPRKYFERDSYCCPNNYRRIISELPKMIYYRMADNLVVNLYTASTAKMKLHNGGQLVVRQETSYPSAGVVTLHIDSDRPASFAVKLRIPRWCHEATVAVNGRPVRQDIVRGKFLDIRRRWQTGDRVRLEMSMPWRLVKGRKIQAGRVAILRGPVVFCLNRVRNKQTKPLDLRELVVVPESLTGPIPDASVRPGGLACQVRAWRGSDWYPHVKPKLLLTLTESADPGSEQTYLKIANPHDSCLVDDELVGGSMTPKSNTRGTPFARCAAH